MWKNPLKRELYLFSIWLNIPEGTILKLRLSGLKGDGNLPQYTLNKMVLPEVPQKHH